MLCSPFTELVRLWKCYALPEADNKPANALPRGLLSAFCVSIAVLIIPLPLFSTIYCPSYCVKCLSMYFVQGTSFDCLCSMYLIKQNSLLANIISNSLQWSALMSNCIKEITTWMRGFSSLCHCYDIVLWAHNRCWDPFSIEGKSSHNR